VFVFGRRTGFPEKIDSSKRRDQNIGKPESIS
jgi:hypothetical protein